MPDQHPTCENCGRPILPHEPVEYLGVTEADLEALYLKTVPLPELRLAHADPAQCPDAPALGL